MKFGTRWMDSLATLDHAYSRGDFIQQAAILEPGILFLVPVLSRTVLPEISYV
jgi:hypothetical protein